jgi:hypothetical protein
VTTMLPPTNQSQAPSRTSSFCGTERFGAAITGPPKKCTHSDGHDDKQISEPDLVADPHALPFTVDRQFAVSAGD